MSDLISRTELFNSLARVPIGPYAIDERAQIINVINEIEALDLVLCEECRYYMPEFDTCTIKAWDLSATEYPKVDADGFCYRGERIEERTDMRGESNE